MQRWFFTGMGLVFLAVAIAGFGPSFVFRIVRGEFGFPVRVYLHAVVMFGWLGLYITQSALIASRNLRVHRTLGAIGTVWFVFVMATAFAVSFVGLLTPHPPALEQLIDNIFFLQLCAFIIVPTFMALALAARRTRPADHKRYMYFLTFFLIEAAASRMTWLPGLGSDDAFLFFQYAWLDLLLVPLVLFDLKTLGRLSQATVIGGAILLAYQAIALLVWDSSWWLATVNAFEAMLAGPE